MYRTLFSILAVFVAALGVVRLTFSASTTGAADFSFVLGAEPQTLDPQKVTGVPAGRVLRGILEGLTRPEASSLEPAPGMAESWEVSADRLTYTFHLRQGARWSDGHPVTAQDFVFAWRRLLEPSVGAKYAALLFPVRYAEAFNTYAEHRERLASGLLPQLTARSAQGSLTAGELQLIFEEHLAHSALAHCKAPNVQRFLHQRTGVIAGAELEALRAEISAEVARLKGLLSEAQQHLGVDAGFFAPDPLTFVVQLKAPTPYFLELTHFYPTFPVPRWVLEAPGNANDWFLPEKIVTNGPFLLKEWQVGLRIRLARSPHYWGKEQVRSRTIDALPVESQTRALNLYLTGEADWVHKHYPSDLAPRLKPLPDFYSTQGLSIYYYRLNVNKPPFNDVRVRKAFNLAIDRTAIAEQVLGAGQTPALHFVPPGIPGYKQPPSPLGLEVERARELLREAGYPNGEGFPEVGILFNTYEMHRKIAEVIADQLRRNLGVTVSAYNQEWQSYQETVRAGDYTVARAAWVGDYKDPNTFLDMWVTNGGNNQTGFSSPTYDRLIAAAGDVGAFLDSPDLLMGELKEQERASRLLRAAQAERTQQAGTARTALRMHLFREAEAILIEDELPILPIYYYVLSGLRRPQLQGFHTMLKLSSGEVVPNVQEVYPLRDIWLPKTSEEGPLSQ